MATWWRELRGVTVDPSVIDEFHGYEKYAREHDISYPEWCAYSWNKRELAAAQKKFAAEPSPANFGALRVSASGVIDPLQNLGRQAESDALDQEMYATAERLIKSAPGAAAYRIVPDFYGEQGDRLKASKPAEARQDFVRAVELSDLLPADNADDVHRRVVSYERIGDMDATVNKNDDARAWFV